jgi:hypothetical protein
MPKRPTFELLLVLFILISHLFVAFAPANNLMNWYTTDDAFYYFKVAQNVSEGHGFTFDGISRASGFHPAWMLVCIPVFALARFNLILPLRILVIISALFSAGSGVLLYRVLRRVLSTSVAVLMTIFWTLSTSVHPVITQLGMESGINAFSLILLLFLLVRFEQHYPGGNLDGPSKPERKKYILAIAGLTAAGILTLLSRLDNIFIVLIAGLWIIFRKPNLRYLLVCYIVMVFSNVFVSYFLRVGFREHYQQFMPSIYWMVAISLVIKTGVYYFSGLFNPQRSRSIWKDLLVVVGGVTVASGIVSGMMLLVFKLGVFISFPRTVLLIDWVLSLLTALIFSLAVRWIGGIVPPVSARFPALRMLAQNWKRWLMAAVVFFLPIGIILLVYMLGNRLYFDTFSPVSGQIKHWWGTLYTVYGRPVDTLWAYFGFPDRLENGPWGLAFSGLSVVANTLGRLRHIRDREVIEGILFSLGASLAVIGFLIAIFNRRKFLKIMDQLCVIPLLGGALVQLFYYQGTAYVNTRGWYWVAEMLCITVIAGILLDLIFLGLQKGRIRQVIADIVLSIVGVFLVINFMYMLVQLVPPVVQPQNVDAYLGGPQALEEVTEQGALIGSTGGGVVAYFLEGRTIVNLDGLMNSSRYFEMMKAGTASQYLDEIDLDYVYGNEYMITESEPYAAIFRDRLEKIGLVGGSTLFRYLPDK